MALLEYHGSKRLGIDFLSPEVGMLDSNKGKALLKP